VEREVVESFEGTFAERWQNLVDDFGNVRNHVGGSFVVADVGDLFDSFDPVAKGLLFGEWLFEEEDWAVEVQCLVEGG
jgi:hypothetical protein